MKKNKFTHLTEEQRAIIRDMIYSGFSARQIAQELGVEHTTITREVKRNRIVKIPKPRKANPSLYCKKYIRCGIKNVVCQNCTSPHTYCKSCPHVKCYKNCKEFEYIECPKTKAWPYICPNMCFDRNTCRFPKCSYSPLKAHISYTKKLIESRQGINISIDDLIEIVSKIKPLIKRGMSPYAALTSIDTEINIDVRTIYRYLELGIIDIPAIKLPRKVRYKKRKNYKPVIKDKVNRDGPWIQRLFEAFEKGKR